MKAAFSKAARVTGREESAAVAAKVPGNENLSGQAQCENTL